MTTPAHAEPRAVTALDAVRTFDCRGHPECPRPAATNRGPYAYLCDLHTAEKRAGQGGDHSVRVPRATAIPPNGFRPQARVLDELHGAAQAGGVAAGGVLRERVAAVDVVDEVGHRPTQARERE